MNMPVTSAILRIILPLPATGFTMSIMRLLISGIKRAGVFAGSAFESERMLSKRSKWAQTVSYIVFVAVNGKSLSRLRTITMGSTAPLKQVSTRFTMPEEVSASSA